nr:44 kda hemoglobin B1 chain {N-terminal} [Lamellibrachia sp.=deep-sea tube worms, 1, Peptide Partial, 16 aa] [Lamellibrachia sp.]
SKFCSEGDATIVIKQW